MSFLLLDDEFWTHEKVVAVLSSVPRPDRGTTRFIAIAAWTLMASFCARQKVDDGRFTLSQACRLSFCDERRMGMALRLMVEHRMMLEESEGRFRFHNWSKWRRPKRRGDVDEQEPDTSRADAEHEPSTRRARAEQTPSTSQARAEHEPTVLNDSSDLRGPLARAPDPSPSPSPSPISYPERESARALRPTEPESNRGPLGTESHAGPGTPRDPATAIRGTIANDSRGVDQMNRALAPRGDAYSRTIEIISETRIAAGGHKFVPAGHADTDAVHLLTAWAAAHDEPETMLRAALAGFWGTHKLGPKASIRWFTEDPAQWLPTTSHHARSSTDPAVAELERTRDELSLWIERTALEHHERDRALEKLAALTERIRVAKARPRTGVAA